MIYTEITKLALRICFEAHKEQTDKSGLPYVFHPFHLAESMTSEYACVCALLHDVMEDTPTTREDLERAGIPKECTDVLALLTHADDYEITGSVCLCNERSLYTQTEHLFRELLF